MRILVVEHDKQTAPALERSLRDGGYGVDLSQWVEDGTEMAVSHAYDLLLLDASLPGRAAFRIVRTLRVNEDAIPILMLSSGGNADDVVASLNAGADACIRKPIDPEELLARVRALLRRGSGHRPDRLLYADVEMDRLNHLSFRGGEPLELTPREFQLLEAFLLTPERVLSRSELVERIWGSHLDGVSNVVDVNVGHLRRKLHRPGKDPLIHTVRGLGYVLKDGRPSSDLFAPSEATPGRTGSPRAG